MLYTEEEAFSRAVKAQAPTGAILLYGTEGYLIEAWRKRLLRPFGGEQDTFNLQRLDGRQLNTDALLDAVETLPLMAQQKGVWVDGLQLKGMPAGEWDKLVQILEDIPPSCTLLFTTSPDTFDPKSAQGKKWIALCARVGTAVQLGTRSSSGLVTFLRNAAKKQGCDLSPDLARYLLRTVDNDMLCLSREIEKVCAYAGGGTLTKEQVDAVAISRTEARVFDLSKAILAEQPQRAMELLHDLFFLREQPVAILAALATAYIDLYRVRVAKLEGKTPADVVKTFGYKGREFRVKNAWNNRLSVQVLRASLEALAQCDRRLKSSGGDGKILLEQTVIQLFWIQGKDRIG